MASKRLNMSVKNTNDGNRMAERMAVLASHVKRNEDTVTVGGAKFRYTRDGSSFTYHQRQNYEDNGYILVKSLLPDQLIDECTERFVDVCEGRVPKGGMTLMKDISYVGATPANHRPHQYVYNKLQDIVWDQVLAKYFLYPKLLDVVENFTGPNIMAMHSMLINKPPDAGTLSSTHPLHQDLHYFAFRPADWIVAAWTAMERIDEENGCLKVIPGTHKGHLLPHEYPEMGGIYNKAFFEAKGYVGDKKPIPVIMDKGDTVFFHPLLIHGSGPNLSKRFRKAISCHYAASECYYVDIRGTSQQNAIDEITDGAKRRGILLDMEDYWRFRNRLARGKMINL